MDNVREARSFTTINMEYTLPATINNRKSDSTKKDRPIKPIVGI